MSAPIIYKALITIEPDIKLSLLTTVAVAGIGGAIAAMVHAPIPWLLGSLLFTAVLTACGFKLQKPSSTIERCMRVLIGTALGSSVANSLGDFGGPVILSIVASFASVIAVVIGGSWFFRRWIKMARGEAFLCALPGGLSFMLALADDARVATPGSRPRIALVHTVRVVALVLFISLIAFVLGTEKPQESFADWFTAGLLFDWQLLLVIALALISGVVARIVSIAGGDVTIPLVISSLAYASGLVDIELPQIVLTLAMLTFGSILGYEIGSGPHSEYPRLAGGSLVFTAMAFLFGGLFAFVFGEMTGLGFLTLFLALAPGGIAEIALISLSLGLDVGLIALVHLCRFLFLMLAGPVGLRVIGGARVKSDATDKTIR